MVKCTMEESEPSQAIATQTSGKLGREHSCETAGTFFCKDLLSKRLWNNSGLKVV